jgi:hypothetical protein
MKIVKWFTVLSAGVLLSTVAESASAQPPGPPFQQSDIVQWQVPGEGTKTYFFPEGGAQSFQYNFLGPNVVQAGLTDTIFQFTQPVPDPDPITDPANPNVSDILAVKVIGNTYNLSFWSDGSALTSAQFLAPLNLVAPVTVPIAETGGLQNFQGLFPSLNQLYVASDLNNLPIQDPTGIVPTGGFGGGASTFHSDYLTTQAAANSPIFQDAFNNDVNGPEMAEFNIPQMTVTNFPVNPGNQAIVFLEDAADSVNPDPSTAISDILTMSVIPTGGTFTLNFSYWSEDPSLTPQAFETQAFGGPPPPNTFVLESGHPDISSIFFGNGPRPFFDFRTKSDPPVPEPSTLVISSVLFAIFGVVWSSKRLQRTKAAPSTRHPSGAPAGGERLG